MTNFASETFDDQPHIVDVDDTELRTTATLRGQELRVVDEILRAQRSAAFEKELGSTTVTASEDKPELRGAGTLAQVLGPDKAEQLIADQEAAEAINFELAIDRYGPSNTGRGNTYDRFDFSRLATYED